MDSITSLELKDLFHKCPRLKSKLSGQELRAIADIIEQRVRIQHMHLLDRIHRLKMHRSAAERKITRVVETSDAKLPSPAKRDGDSKQQSILISSVKGNSPYSLPHTNTKVRFALPSYDDRVETQSTEVGNNSEHKYKEIGKSSEDKDKSSENRRLIEFCQAANARDAGSSEQVEKCNKSQEQLEAEAEYKDKLIANLKKENEFIKTSLREKSDYGKILEESAQLQKCIDQLRLDQITRRKDNFNLMKDIERMKYALKYNEYPDDSCSESDTSTKIRPANIMGKTDLDEGKIRSDEKESKNRYSVLVSSQYLYSGCCSPDKCQWRMQLKSCRDVLSKKYRENAYLRFMLSQTQERLSQLTSVPLPPFKQYKNI